MHSCSDGGGDDEFEPSSDLERQAEFDMLLAGMCQDRDPYRHTDKDTQTKNWREWAGVGAHNDRQFYDGQVYTHTHTQRERERTPMGRWVSMYTHTHTHTQMRWWIYIHIYIPDPFWVRV